MGEQFSQRLQSARRMRDLSQEKLSEISGLKPAAISHFETGARKPSFDNLKRLAVALAVTVDYLMGRTDDPSGTSGADQAFRDFGDLTHDQQTMVSDMMALLAKKNKGG